MSVYKRIARPLLFTLPPETSHRVTTRAMEILQRSDFVRSQIRARVQYTHPSLETKVFGFEYPNPVGVAAGFDKNCELVPLLADLGFGFIHGGTVTPDAQVGNPQPRVFRLTEDKGLLNRMGLPNQGAERVARRLESIEAPSVPFAIHIDKMNDSDPEEALDDYRTVFERLYSYADYFAIGFCPNTPDTFDKTEIEYMADIFDIISGANVEDKPVVVRAGREDPDENRVKEIVELVKGAGLDGILTGTPKRPPIALHSSHAREEGNVTGRPVEQKGTELVERFYRQTDLPIIGTGGVDSAETAYRKIRAGASLVKLYTGFIYEGPATARKINSGLVRLLERDGFSSIDEAVGVDAE